MKNIFKKTALSCVACLALTSTVPSSAAFAFGFGNIVSAVSGGSASNSNTNWSDLASQAKGAEKDIFSGSRLLALSSITMAKALGYKEEAAALEAQVKMISEDGSVSGDYDLGETAKQSDSILEKMTADKENLLALNENQKAELTASMKEYLVGGLLYGKGLKTAVSASEQAKDAPMLEKVNFINILKLLPTALSGAGSFFKKIPDVYTAMTTADIALPENADSIKGLTDF